MIINKLRTLVLILIKSIDKIGTIVHIKHMPTKKIESMNAKNEPLLERTMRLINRADVSPAILCKCVGVSIRWYYKLMSGQIKDPSVNKIQRIHDYLQAGNRK